MTDEAKRDALALVKAAYREDGDEMRGRGLVLRVDAPTSFSVKTSATSYPSRRASARQSSSCRSTPSSRPSESLEIRT